MVDEKRGFVPERPVGSILLVSAPGLQLFGRVRKGQEPLGVQALGSEAPVEGFYVGVGGGPARPAEVECQPMHIGPKIKVA